MDKEKVLDTRFARLLVVMGLVIAILFFGSSWLGRQDALQEASTCDLEKGSRRVFPASGPIALSSAETELAGLIAPVVMPKGAGKGMVSVSNRGAAAIVVTFHDEDGAPRARAFARAGDSASVELPAGSYDAMAISGSDWNGEAFALGCAKAYKVRGVLAVEDGKASSAELSEKSGFVAFNRKDAAAAGTLAGASKEPDASQQRPERGARRAGGVIEAP